MGEAGPSSNKKKTKMDAEFPDATMGEAGPSSKKKTKMDAEFTDTDLFDPFDQNFANISGKPTFVDHSLLNQVFFKTGRKLYISAPKRSCKSTNMNMIKQFFQIDKDGKVDPELKKRPNYKIFEHLDIVKNGNDTDLKKHFGAHPVVFVDFKAPPSIRNFEDALEHYYNRIKVAFREHEAFLLKNMQNEGRKMLCLKWLNSISYQEVGKGNVLSGLADLCECLYQAHNKKRVLILVDECDAVITSALCGGASSGAIRLISGDMSSMLSAVTKGEMVDTMVQAVLLTGVSYISGIGYSQDIHAVACRFLDDTNDTRTSFKRKSITPFYGLHESQLDGLLNNLKEPLKFSDDDIKKKKETIKDEYNGYYTKEGQSCIYPLEIVVCYLINGKKLLMKPPSVINTYKKVTADLDISSDILKLLGFGHIIVKSSVNDAVNIDKLITLRDSPDESQANVFFLLLMEVGLLTFPKSTEQDDSKPELSERTKQDKLNWKLKMPNQATIKCFQQMLEEAKVRVGKFDNKHQKDCAEDISNIVTFFLRDDTVNYKRKLKCLYNNLKSLFKGFEGQELKEYSENSLQGLMFMTLSRACNPKCFSEITTELNMKDNKDRKGRIDIWMFDEVRNFAMIWEVKFNAESADKTKTSIHALKEIRGQAKKAGRNDVVCYSDIFKQREITNYLMVGLTIDEALQPSISVATSRQEDPDSFICVSTTEVETYKLYDPKKCCNLLRTS